MDNAIKRGTARRLGLRPPGRADAWVDWALATVNRAMIAEEERAAYTHLAGQLHAIPRTLSDRDRTRGRGWEFYRGTIDEVTNPDGDHGALRRLRDVARRPLTPPDYWEHDHCADVDCPTCRSRHGNGGCATHRPWPAGRLEPVKWCAEHGRPAKECAHAWEPGQVEYRDPRGWRVTE